MGSWIKSFILVEQILAWEGFNEQDGRPAVSGGSGCYHTEYTQTDTNRGT